MDCRKKDFPGSLIRVSMSNVKLSIIIINYNTGNLTLGCLRSIFEKNWETKFDVWVIDNGSSDNSIEKIKKEFPRIKTVLSDKNLGFAGGNNLVLKQVDSDYCLLLNSDTEVYDGALDELVEFAERENCGITSCKLVNSDGSFQPNGGDLPFGLSLFVWLSGIDDILFFLKRKLPSYHRQFMDYFKDGKGVGWVSGSVMLIKKEVTDKIGFLDDAIFMYGEDTEYCLRAKRAGFTVGWTDKAIVKHLGGASSKEPTLKQWTGEFKGLLYIYLKYYGFLAAAALKIFIYLFIFVRMAAFFVVGRPQVSRVYAKVLVSI